MSFTPFYTIIGQVWGNNSRFYCPRDKERARSFLVRSKKSHKKSLFVLERSQVKKTKTTIPKRKLNKSPMNIKFNPTYARTLAYDFAINLLNLEQTPN